MSLSIAMVAMFENQHAVASNEQLFQLGMTWSGLRSHCELGELERLTPRVVRLAGSAMTLHQRLVAAALDVGSSSAVCIRSAGAYWTLPGFRPEPIDVMVERPPGGKPLDSPLCTVHYTRILLDTHVVEHNGFRVTTPARTLFDLAATIRPERMTKLVDRAWSRGLVNFWVLHRTLKELEGRGRAGIVTMREILDNRGPDYLPTDSNMEAHFHDLMKDANIGGLCRQVNSGSSAMWLGRMDFRHESLPLVLQIDSELYHSSISDREKDAAETAALVHAGYVVVRIAEFDLWHNPRAVIDAVRQGIRDAQSIVAAERNPEPASTHRPRTR